MIWIFVLKLEWQTVILYHGLDFLSLFYVKQTNKQTTTQKQQNQKQPHRGFLIVHDREFLDTSILGGWRRKSLGNLPHPSQGHLLKVRTSLLCADNQVWEFTLAFETSLPWKVPCSSFDCPFWKCLGVTPLRCQVPSPIKSQGAQKLSLLLVNPSPSQTTHLNFSWETGSKYCSVKLVGSTSGGFQVHVPHVGQACITFKNYFWARPEI